EIRRLNTKVTLRETGAVVGKWHRFRLEQVVTNLLSNALKYGEAKPVELAVEGDATTARLEVRDQGPRIAPQHHRRIFERFNRGTRSGSGGLGLGLFIVREIVEASRGRIEI